jgi:hypothetical protein
VSNAIPVRVAQFRTANFAAWLAANGAEVSPPTNPYEVIRYRAYEAKANKASVNVIYRKESGLLTFAGQSRKHYELFLAGKSLDKREAPQGKVPKGATPAPSKGEVRRQALLERDGPDCWFCGRHMGDDVTIEHLVPRSKGGVNHLDNYALAHGECNRAAADKTLVEKIALRAEMRAKLEAPHG